MLIGGVYCVCADRGLCNVYVLIGGVYVLLGVVLAGRGFCW